MTERDQQAVAIVLLFLTLFVIFVVMLSNESKKMVVDGVECRAVKVITRGSWGFPESSKWELFCLRESK